ncbi:unnamed protein product [Schistosoma margrebowiei]|uniref:Uncharacterized protein n=1 Tax=Schistosoma margrebowiei TaxID=48269 RepID=A0A183MDA5_9TREM|nr:unnamed protein product [Schistosoma margrebowiei]
MRASEEENDTHTKRVALMLSKQAYNAHKGWESHGPRIIKASLKTRKEGITMNIIQCYAPTNGYTTWTSPDHSTQNQIEHICINKSSGVRWKT